MASTVRFTPAKALTGGVIATMTSGGVQAEVGRQVGRIAASANAQAKARRSDLPRNVRHGLARHSDYPASDPYVPEVRVGRFDTLGVVLVATREGAHDQNQHQTLDSLNH